MYKIDNATAVTPMPTVGAVGPNPDGYFQSRTVVDADWLNTTMSEVCEVITSASITLSKTSQNQLYLAVIDLINAGPPRPGITAIVEDTDPHMGGNFDVSGFNIQSASNGDITFTADTTGYVKFNGNIRASGNLVHSGDTDTYIGHDTSPASFIGATVGGTQIFDITSSGIRFGGANVRINAFLDEDAMTSNSATAISSQQAAKAYVDNYTTPAKLDFISSYFAVKITASAVTYGFQGSSTQSTAWTTEGDTGYTVQADGVLSKFYLSYSTASLSSPSSTNITFVLRKNGADTAVTMTLTGANPSGSVTGTSVSVVAGDVITWKSTNNFAQTGGTAFAFSSMLLTYN